MLQVNVDPHKVAKKECATPLLESTHLVESRDCLPAGLQEVHLQSVRRQATLLASGTQPAAERTLGGEDATLDAAGFKEVTSLCCPSEMEAFFGRLLAKMGLAVCSKPHVQGLMHWFSCVPDMD